MEEYYVPRPMNQTPRKAMRQLPLMWQQTQTNNQEKNSSSKVWWFVIIASLIIIGMGILAVF